MIGTPLALTTIRTGLLRGLLQTEMAMATIPRTFSRPLETNKETAFKILREGMGIGHEPYTQRLAFALDPRLIAQAAQSDREAANYAQTMFDPLNSLVGALVTLSPMSQSQGIFPGDLEHWIPLSHQQEACALAVYIDQYLLQRMALPFAPSGPFEVFSVVDPLERLEFLSIAEASKVVEHALILRTLKVTRGHWERAATLLGLTIDTLRIKASYYEIDARRPSQSLPPGKTHDEKQIADLVKSLPEITLEEAQKVVERHLIHLAVKRANNDQRKAALLLAVDLSYLSLRLNTL